jgi:putative transposase
MPYRTIEIAWLPRSQTDWRTFSAVRQEAAAVWNWLVEAHADVRAGAESWPSKAEWQKRAKGRFSNLHSQSVQQTIADFCEAVTATTVLRHDSRPDARYPFRKPKYRCVIFTNQAARVRDGVLTLPCGQAGRLRVRIPEAVNLPGRLMEVRLHFGKVELVCQVPDVVHPTGPVIGIDLGVNTLLAATDGERVVLVSGRSVKSVVRLRNKRIGEITAKQSHKVKGSRRWRKLQRRKYRTLDRAHHQVRDLCHKATRKVADAFPHAKAYVGEPFNDAAQRLGRVQAQQVNQACNAVLIAMLAYKLASAIRVSEEFTSQTCPVCGERNRCRRTYRCVCGCTAPRDVVGAVNIRSIGTDGQMAPGRSVPNAVHWVHPTKYAGPKPAS